MEQSPGAARQDTDPGLHFPGVAQAIRDDTTPRDALRLYTERTEDGNLVLWELFHQSPLRVAAFAYLSFPFLLNLLALWPIARIPLFIAVAGLYLRRRSFGEQHRISGAAMWPLAILLEVMYCATVMMLLPFIAVHYMASLAILLLYTVVQE